MVDDPWLTLRGAMVYKLCIRVTEFTLNRCPSNSRDR